jgi:hypothetical protein
MKKALLKEAVVVGAMSVPVWFVTRKLISLRDWSSETQKDAWTTFVAGVAFHLLAEAGGLNAWYIQHGVAAHRMYAPPSKNEPRRSCGRRGAVCDTAVSACSRCAR